LVICGMLIGIGQIQNYSGMVEEISEVAICFF